MKKLKKFENQDQKLLFKSRMGQHWFGHKVGSNLDFWPLLELLSTIFPLPTN
jgi:hypothetical protein